MDKTNFKTLAEKEKLIRLWVNTKHHTLSFNDIETIKLLIKQHIKRTDENDLLHYIDLPRYVYEDIFLK